MLNSIRYYSLSIFLLFNLTLCYSQADKVAVVSGSWTSTTTWGGPVPVDGDIIQIPSGINVTIAGGADIILDDATLVIQGELTVANAGFNYSSLTINGAGGVFIEIGGQITDPSFFGFSNFVQVNGVNLWGGRLSNGLDPAPLFQDDFTPTTEINEPPTLLNPLPVELISFVGYENEGSITLDWVTGSELNNEGFEIQKSYDGQNFEMIGFVEGNGTTSDRNTYTFQDVILTSAYFQLKQIDYDGKYEFSPLIYIAIDDTHTSLNIYPNPTKTGIINISGPVTSFVLYDENGRVLLENTNTTSHFAQNQISEYLSNQEVGIYLLATQLAEKQQVSRIIKVD